MTPLRQRMLDAMLQRGFAQRTQGCYIEAIARMARHDARGPALLTPEEVSAYLLHLVKDRKLSFSTVNQCASASRFLFETVLGRKADGLRPPMARVPQKQPHLLAREEIARLFACCAHPAHRMALQTIMRPGCASPRHAPCGWPTSTARRTACAYASTPARAAPTATQS